MTIATDTSALVAYLQNEAGADMDLLDAAALSGQLRIPPVVITEILSDGMSRKTLSDLLTEILPLPLMDGYWERAGSTRGLLRQKGLKANIADTLIAQSCIDHDIALITRDNDFRHFAKHCGLKLA
ncbi:MAG TPA: PIN domain-containing protein [Rhizomicrobium sp.]|nr:PIN domain-containing protein [Rhizomicrobium sp.]